MDDYVYYVIGFELVYVVVFVGFGNWWRSVDVVVCGYFVWRGSGVVGIRDVVY